MLDQISYRIITDAKVLPEILKIIEELISIYNDMSEGQQALMKLCSENYNGYVTRYQTFEDKNILLNYIQDNCPAGIELTYD